MTWNIIWTKWRRITLMSRAGKRKSSESSGVYRIGWWLINNYMPKANCFIIFKSQGKCRNSPRKIEKKTKMLHFWFISKFSLHARDKGGMLHNNSWMKWPTAPKFYTRVRLTDCLSVCLSVYLSVCLSVCMSVCLSASNVLVAFCGILPLLQTLWVLWKWAWFAW